ncbi:NosD domain-containing protein [Chloroflexota bacterium]
MIREMVDKNSSYTGGAMKKRIALITLFILVLTLFAFPAPASAAELHAGSGQTYETISDAVAAASGGDTIIVHDGTYNENIYIAADSGLAGLTIRSENGYATTTVYSSSGSCVFDIRVDNVTIDGFSIYGATTSELAGIFLITVEGCVIQNNRCGWDSDHKNRNGISLRQDVDNCLITNNICNYNTDAGIVLRYSNGNTIANNTCNSNTAGDGIRVWYTSTGNTISNNTCNGNSSDGVDLDNSSENNTIVGNELSSNSSKGIRVYDDNNIIYLNDLRNNSSSPVGTGGGDQENSFSTPTKVCYFHNSSHQEFLGNYYGDDYSGADDGSGGRVAGDGIGDTNIPHDLEGVSDDNYPLMEAPGNYAVQAWYLSSDNTMYEADAGKGPGSVQLAASGSNIWISDQTAQGNFVFSNDTWTGQVVFTTAPTAEHTFTVEIGSSTNGSDFTAGGPDATITGNGNATTFTYTTDAGQVTMSDGKYLALKITNNSVSSYNVETGGAWSYTSNPAANAPNYPVPEPPAIVLLGSGLAGLAAYLVLKRGKRDSSSMRARWRGNRA